MALGVYGRGEPRWWQNAPASIAAPRCATPSPAAQCGPDRRGRPNALASVGFVPGAKARSAPQSRGLASLVRVTWCFACSPHGSACSTGRAEAVVGITCSKPAGRRCWVATAGDCMYSRQHLKPSTSDRPGRSYTRLCGVSATSAAMRQGFKTPRDLNQWTRESEGHMTRSGAPEPLHPEQNTSAALRGMNRALSVIYGQLSERTTQWWPSGTERRYFSYPIKARGCRQ